MTRDQEIVVVGRDSTTALLDNLIDRRDRRPVPLVLAYGPGGSGKTTLLDLAEQRCHRNVPVARIDLNQPGSTGCQDVLYTAFDQLRRYVHPSFGRLRMPRFELARLIQTCVPPPDDPVDPYVQARKLLSSTMVGLATAGDIAADAADQLPATGGWVGKLIRPVTKRLGAAATLAPSWLRTVLMRPRYAGAIRWFERHLGPNLLELPGRCRIDVVVAEIWKQLNREDSYSELLLEQLFVECFLADLEAAYRRGRTRRVNCLLLLDNMDMLPGDEPLLAGGHDDTTSRNGANLLDLLAQAKLRKPDLPVLIVATQQSNPSIAGISGRNTTSTNPPANPQDQAGALYRTWRRRFEQTTRDSTGSVDAAYLPIPMRPFTLDQTRQFLDAWNRPRASTAETTSLVEELHMVTRGHPLAVRLATQVIDRTYDRNRITPSVRESFSKLMPAQERGSEATDLVGDYLLLRFLQRLRDSEPSDRSRVQSLLAILAAPRRIDLPVIELLLPDRDAQEIWDRLSLWSFVDASERELVLHPLLRDLLAQQLVNRSSGNGLDLYTETHKRLRDHYQLQERSGHPGAQIDRLYHELALGGTRSVSDYLNRRIQSVDDRWPTEFESIAEAPMPPPPEVGSLQEFLEPIRGALTGRNNPVDQLVDRTWRLRSSTSTTRWTADTYSGLDEAYRRLESEDNRAVNAQLTRYRTLSRKAEHGMNTQIREIPEQSRGGNEHPYPLVWPPRMWFRSSAVTATLLLIAGYVTATGWYHVQYCAPSAFTLTRQVTTLFDDTLALDKQSDGQCVGITDTGQNFTEPPTADQWEVKRLTELIARENADVTRAHQNKNRPFVTVVVPSVLSTVSAQPGRDISLGVNELRGALVAQRDHNKSDGAVQPDNPVLIKLLPANFGGSTRSAEEVATKISELAQQDPSIVAVTGMGETRRTTLKAAEILGDSGISMVGTPSGDSFSSKPYFFRIPPPSSRQSEVALTYAKTHLSDRQVFLLFNPEDDYSARIKDSYVEQSAMPGTKLALDIREYSTGTSTNPSGDIGKRAGALCDEANESDRKVLILYAGRANETPTLLNQINTNPNGCGGQADVPGDEPVVLGSDDLIHMETVDFNDLRQRTVYVSGQLFYPSFGLSQTERAKRGLPRHNFYGSYASLQRSERGKSFRTNPNGDTMLAYDAVALVADAVGRAYSANRRLVPLGSAPPTRGDVYENLRSTTGPETFHGLTGAINFPGATGDAPGTGADPAAKLVVLRRVVEQDGKLVGILEDANGDQ